MGRKRHTPEQIITALREAEVGLARGKSVKLMSRELGITEQTYYRWRLRSPAPGLPAHRRVQQDAVIGRGLQWRVHVGCP